MVMGILGVPALASESSRRHVHCPPITFPSALITLGCFHDVTFGGCFCETEKYIKVGLVKEPYVNQSFHLFPLTFTVYYMCVFCRYSLNVKGKFTSESF